MDLNRSFLTPTTIVSTVSPSQPPPISDTVTENDTALAYLQKINATQVALLKRVDELRESRCQPHYCAGY